VTPLTRLPPRLPSAQAQEVIARDLRDGQYFVTGDLSKEIFADDCRFRDPTNDVVGLARYITALGLLFERGSSRVELRSAAATGARQVTATWTLGGYLRLPWHPYVPPFEGARAHTRRDGSSAFRTTLALTLAASAQARACTR
jgi:hypothetical protein